MSWGEEAGPLPFLRDPGKQGKTEAAVLLHLVYSADMAHRFVNSDGPGTKATVRSPQLVRTSLALGRWSPRPWQYLIL